MNFVSVLHFFTRVNTECIPFERLLCIRAEKNSEQIVKILTLFTITFILDV